jgi:MoxR-like ATPase
VPYPTESEEVAILQRFNQISNDNVMDLVEPVITNSQVLDLRQVIKSVIIEEKLLHFIARITHSSRNDKAVYLGASPRASLSILNASKAFAALSGRDFVIPDDIINVAAPVLRHRIILTPEKEMEGVKEDEVIQKIVLSLEVPR